MKLSDKSKMMLDGIKEQRSILRDKVQLVLLTDLVDKLDPEHDYHFDAEKSEFIKVKKGEAPPKKEDGNGS